MSYRLYSSSLETCADELPPIAQAGGNMCSSCIVPIAHSGPDELAHVAPIAHPGQICADELSSIIVQALKTCADELPS